MYPSLVHCSPNYNGKVSVHRVTTSQFKLQTFLLLLSPSNFHLLCPQLDSSFDCYTPLERPAPQPVVAQNASTTAAQHSGDREDGECDTDSDSPAAVDSSSDSDTGKIQQRAIILPRRKRSLPVAPPAPSVEQQQLSQGTVLARKKYNIWTEKIREDSLTETMRNFGVNRDGGDSRSVEWYDHTLTNRFSKDGKTNRLKRRRHSGGRRKNDQDADDDDEEQDGNSMDMDCGGGGKRVCYNNSRVNRARVLDDLETPEDAPLEEVAKEIARNLKESNEGLIGE